MGTALSSGGSYVLGGTVTVSGTTSDTELTVIGGTRTTSGTTTLGTVGANKVWRIYSAYVGAFSGGSGTNFNVNVHTLVFLKGCVKQVVAGQSYGHNNAGTVVSFAGKYITATAGQTVTLVTDSTDSVSAWVAYQEISV